MSVVKGVEFGYDTADVQGSLSNRDKILKNTNRDLKFDIDSVIILLYLITHRISSPVIIFLRGDHF